MGEAKKSRERGKGQDPKKSCINTGNGIKQWTRNAEKI